MAIDTSGLLTGLLTPSQRSQQRMGNNANMAQTGLMSQVLNLANTFTDATSNLIGADTRSPEQIGMAKVAGLLEAGDIDGAINILKDVDPEAAMTLIARQKQEQERLADVAKAEEAAQKRLEAQTTFLSNAFPDHASILTPLLEAGVPLNTLIDFAKGEGIQGIGKEELIAMGLANLPEGADPLAVIAAISRAYSATDERAAEPPTFEAPNTALINSVSTFVDQMDVTNITDQYGKVPWDAGINNYSVDDYKNEVSYVAMNRKDLTIPQVAELAVKYYSDNPDANANDFQASILRPGVIEPSAASSSNANDSFLDLK